MDLYDKISEASAFLINQIKSKVDIAIVLGTGLNNFAKRIDDPVTIPFGEIPHFVSSTVESHSGNLISGKLDGRQVLIMQGRFHYYEGYSMEQVTFPIRVMNQIGIRQLIITNASGSLNPDLKTGDILIVTDHISFLGPNPLRGIQDERLGERFPDMTKTYNVDLITKATEVAKRENISSKEGIYSYVQGPSLETPSEHRFLRMMGADAVGMSTVPEVIVARQCCMEVCVLSCITNECMSEGVSNETSLAEVVETAATVEPKLSRLIIGLLATTR